MKKILFFLFLIDLIGNLVLCVLNYSLLSVTVIFLLIVVIAILLKYNYNNIRFNKILKIYITGLTYLTIYRFICLYNLSDIVEIILIIPGSIIMLFALLLSLNFIINYKINRNK